MLVNLSGFLSAVVIAQWNPSYPYPYQQSNPVMNFLLFTIIGLAIGAIFAFIVCSKTHSVEKGTGQKKTFKCSNERAINAIKEVLAGSGYSVISEDKEKGQFFISADKFSLLRPKVTIYVTSVSKSETEVEVIVKISEFKTFDLNTGSKRTMISRIFNKLESAVSESMEPGSSHKHHQPEHKSHAKSSESVSHCTKCGTQNPKDAKFCSSCGNKLG